MTDSGRADPTLEKLGELDVAATDVTDAGLVHLKGLRLLSELILFYQGHRRRTIASARGRRSLDLNLTHSDHRPGLMRAIPTLEAQPHIYSDHRCRTRALERADEAAGELNLTGTHINDAGLKQLNGLPNLTELDLTDSGQ